MVGEQGSGGIGVHGTCSNVWTAMEIGGKWKWVKSSSRGFHDAQRELDAVRPRIQGWEDGIEDPAGMTQALPHRDGPRARRRPSGSRVPGRRGPSKPRYPLVFRAGSAQAEGELATPKDGCIDPRRLSSDLPLRRSAARRLRKATHAIATSLAQYGT